MSELATTVRNAGMFKPGVSGNPGGRPKMDATIRDLARTYTAEAIETLAQIMRNRNAPPSARVSAACAILDRGWGKPAQFVENLTVGATLEDFLLRVAQNEHGREPDASDNLLIVDVVSELI